MKKGVYFYRRNFILIKPNYESKIFDIHLVCVRMLF